MCSFSTPHWRIGTGFMTRVNIQYPNHKQGHYFASLENNETVFSGGKPWIHLHFNQDIAESFKYHASIFDTKLICYLSMAKKRLHACQNKASQKAGSYFHLVAGYRTIVSWQGIFESTLVDWKWRFPANIREATCRYLPNVFLAQGWFFRDQFCATVHLMLESQVMHGWIGNWNVS